MYRTIRTILRYDKIHTIRTLYRTIHEHLPYADTIQNFLHTIRYVSYNTDNYGPQFHTTGVNTTTIYHIRIAMNLTTSNTRLYWFVLAILGHSRHFGWKIRFRTNKS